MSENVPGQKRDRLGYEQEQAILFDNRGIIEELEEIDEYSIEHN